MLALKCKMCGGDIVFTGESMVGICDCCGTQITFPKIDTERMTNLFNRANHFRQLGEFDKATATFERILEEDSSLAEAHWGVVLCEYGIVYVEDSDTHKRVPTCHRVKYDSILTNSNYLLTLQYADPVTKGMYEAEAAYIDMIQKRILQVSDFSKTLTPLEPVSPAVVSALLRRAKLFAEDKNWNSADKYYDRALDLYPECSDAYIGKLCVELGCSGEDQIVRTCKESLSEDLTDLNHVYRFKSLSRRSNYIKAVRFADIQTKQRLEQYNAEVEKAIRNAQSEKKQIYSSRIESLSTETMQLKQELEKCQREIKNTNNNLEAEKNKSFIVNNFKSPKDYGMHIGIAVSIIAIPAIGNMTGPDRLFNIGMFTFIVMCICCGVIAAVLSSILIFKPYQRRYKENINRIEKAKELSENKINILTVKHQSLIDEERNLNIKITTNQKTIALWTTNMEKYS